MRAGTSGGLGGTRGGSDRIGLLVDRLIGQQDIVIGAPVANRTPLEVEPLIGCFVNAIAVRMDLSATPTVGELLQRAQVQVLGAQQHQQVPFEQVVEIIQPPRSLAYNAIFQVWLNWLNIDVGAFDLGELQATTMPTPHTVSKFDLKLSLSEAGPKLTGDLEYSTALVDRATAERVYRESGDKSSPVAVVRHPDA